MHPVHARACTDCTDCAATRLVRPKRPGNTRTTAHRAQQVPERKPEKIWRHSVRFQRRTTVSKICTDCTECGCLTPPCMPVAPDEKRLVFLTVTPQKFIFLHRLVEPVRWQSLWTAWACSLVANKVKRTKNSNTRASRACQCTPRALHGLHG